MSKELGQQKSSNLPDNKKDFGRDKKLGQILLELKLVTVNQLARALYIQEMMKANKQPLIKLGQILVSQGVLTLDQLKDTLRRQTHKMDETRKLILNAKEQLEEAKQIAEAKAAKKQQKEQTERTSFWQKLIKNNFKK